MSHRQSIRYFSDPTRHRKRVRSLGCIICRRLGRGYVDASIHHCRFPVGMGMRADDRYAIPLAPAIHQLGMMRPEWPWQDDVPIHAGERPFRARYGVWEQELLEEVCSLLGVDVLPLSHYTTSVGDRCRWAESRV